MFMVGRSPTNPESFLVRLCRSYPVFLFFWKFCKVLSILIASGLVQFQNMVEFHFLMVQSDFVFANEDAEVARQQGNEHFKAPWLISNDVDTKQTIMNHEYESLSIINNIINKTNYIT